VLDLGSQASVRAADMTYTFAHKPKAAEQSVLRKSSLSGRALFERGGEDNSFLRLQRTHGNQAAASALLATTSVLDRDSVETASVPRGYDFSQIPAFARPSADGVASGGWNVRDKSVDDKASAADLVRDKDPQGEKKKETPAALTAPAAPTTKKAGVESFWVNWEDNPDSGPTVAKLKLTFQAKFKNDTTHDPALAEFRQTVSHRLKVTAGPNKGQESNKKLHDDGYSRADDIGNHTIDDIYFLGNDAPGPDKLDKDDVIDYSFTAEQMVIDTSDKNRVIKKLGPYTAGITGKHPRKPFGVPKMIGK
jgi:hypothetical protein